MKALPSITAVLLLGVGAWFLVPDVPPTMPEHAPEGWELPVEQDIPDTEPAPDTLMSGAQVALPSRTPVAVELPEPSTTEPEVDPCLVLRSTIEDLSAENAWLRQQIELLQAHEGLAPYEHFLQSVDADMISDPVQKTWLKHLMGAECPFYLRPGEASYLVENRDETGGYDSFEEMMIHFLGPDRVLREAPPEWIDRMSGYFTAEDWMSIFGEPIPN